jgi:hypothetical protein
VLDAGERGEVGDVGADVLQRVDSALLQQRPAEHGCGDRRLLEQLRAAPSGDDEALDVVGRLFGGVRRSDGHARVIIG